MQIRTNFRHKLKYQRFAASSWQDRKHILTLDEVKLRPLPEQVSILKSPKIQNSVHIVLHLETHARIQDLPPPFLFPIPCSELKTGFCRLSAFNQWKWVQDRYHSERTGTDYENQSATVFIIPNHGSEILNRRDQRVFFPLEVARYLIARSRQRKKNPLAPRVEYMLR